MRAADSYRHRDRADPYPSRSAPRDRYDEPVYRRDEYPAPRDHYERRSYGGGGLGDYYGGGSVAPPPPRRPEPFGDPYPPLAPVRYGGGGGYGAPGGYASMPGLDPLRSGGYDSGASSGTAPVMVPYSRRPAAAPAFPGSVGGYASAPGAAYG